MEKLRKRERVPDYEKIVIYPMDYDEKVRAKLFRVMKRIGVQVRYETYS